MMQKRWRVVATGPWEQLEWQRPLEDAGCEVVLGKSFDQFPGEVYSEQDLIDLLRDADVALVSTRDRITRQVLESSPRLKLVVKATIGVEKIDLEAAADLGIVVVNSPAPENYLGVAEATVGLAIMLVKRLQTAQRLLTEGKWKQRAHEGTLLPFALREQALRRLESLDQHDRQPHGGFCHSEVVLRRGAVHNDDAQISRRLEVDLLHSDGGLHDELQPRRRLQHLSCDPVPSGDQRYIGIPQQVNKVLLAVHLAGKLIEGFP